MMSKTFTKEISLQPTGLQNSELLFSILLFGSVDALIFTVILYDTTLLHFPPCGPQHELT
jgi:hypothetical protein